MRAEMAVSGRAFEGSVLALALAGCSASNAPSDSLPAGSGAGGNDPTGSGGTDPTGAGGTPAPGTGGIGAGAGAGGSSGGSAPNDAGSDVTFDWPESLPGRGECKPGTYSGMFQ